MTTPTCPDCQHPTVRVRGRPMCLTVDCPSGEFVAAACLERGASEVVVLHGTDGPPSDTPLEE